VSLHLDSLRPLLRPQNTSERNIRNVLVDGIGVGLVVGISQFLPVFLARLGASSVLIGLITSLPALTGALLAVPIGRFLERQRNIVPWYSGMRFWVLLSYVFFGLLPFIFPTDIVPLLVIAIWAVATVPSTFVNVAFTVVMGSVAGPNRRFYLMSLRWSSLGITTAIAVTIAGQLLDRIAFPLNYQIVFIGSFTGGLLSFLFSRSITLPDQLPATVSVEGNRKKGVAARVREAFAELGKSPPAFSRLIWSAFLFRCGVAMALPLFPLYWVRQVQASDAWIGAINTANSAVLLVAYFIWTQLVRRRGVGWALIASSFGMACYPLLAGLTDNLWLLLILAGMAGFAAAGNDLVTFDLVLSHAPKEHQTTFVGLYQTLQNTALFVMPLVGTALGDMIGYSAALITAGVLRLAGAGLYFVLRIGQNDPQATAKVAS
jgi:MFS family permease